MAPNLLEKTALCLSGLTALGIGTFILLAPHPFYASYGIKLGDDASLLSELRALAAGLAALGVIMLAGIFRSPLTQVSIVAALTVFLGFPTGRIIGLVVDGMPSASVFGALIVELSIATLCLIAFRKWLLPKRTGSGGRVVRPGAAS
ncbi:DUF4345 domain-containing protein [Sulfitobacter sp. D35]|nr:DUF4345 domain-containing protein [Sulfitobacter sp. D35]